MSVAEYLDAVKERLLTDPLILHFTIVRERSTLTDGHLRARLTLSNGDLLEFSEYVTLSSTGQIEVVTYSYHWADASGNLIRRWDNAPHFPHLSNFPHHIHISREANVTPSKPMDIFQVPDEIAACLSRTD